MTEIPIYKNKAWLYEQYWGDLLTHREIAAKTTVSRDTIRKWLGRHGIPQRVCNSSTEYKTNLFAGFYECAEDMPEYDDWKWKQNSRKLQSERADGVPEQYQPTYEKYEQKEWLYEQYWGQLNSQREIAEKVNVARTKIRMELDRHGIPLREMGCSAGTQSPFRGFYNGDENVPTNEAQQHFDPEKQGQKADWELDARKRDTVSLDWHHMVDGGENA
jgi:predicted DNA-binding protein YlxM (UPF0122 family)